MCNLYSQTQNQDPMRRVFDDAVGEEEMLKDVTGNRKVERIHPKARVVPLVHRGEWRKWLTAPVGSVLNLHRTLPDGELEIVLEAPNEYRV